MGKHERNLSLTELQALFFSDNGTMTSANKTSYEVLFNKLSKEEPMNNDIAKEVLSKLFQQMVGEEIANLGFDFVNGTENSLEPLRRLLEDYKDDFTPNLRVEWDDISIDTLLTANDLETQWKFNIPSLVGRWKALAVVICCWSALVQYW